MTDLLSVYVDLLFWIFQATEIVGMIAYGEGCWIMICEEDLALGPGARLDHSRDFVWQSFIKVWKRARESF